MAAQEAMTIDYPNASGRGGSGGSSEGDGVAGFISAFSAGYREPKK